MKNKKLTLMNFVICIVLLEDNTTKITFIDKEINEVIDMSSISMVIYLDEKKYS